MQFRHSAELQIAMGAIRQQEVVFDTMRSAEPAKKHGWQLAIWFRDLVQVLQVIQTSAEFPLQSHEFESTRNELFFLPRFETVQTQQQVAWT